MHLNHGQHISFFSRKTLNILAKKNGMNFYSTGHIHLITKRHISPVLFYAIVKLSKYGFGFIAKKMVKSKTWEDHLTQDNK